MTVTDRMTTVQGRCPACGWASLFLGDGGYITCSRLECPSPEAAHEAIEERAGANAYDRAINTPPSAETCAAIRERLESGAVPRRKVRAKAASSAGRAPAADRAAVRDRIAEAIRGLNEGGTLADLDEEADVLAIADAVLAVLPAPDQRAAVLLEAAAHVQTGRTPYNTEAAEQALKNGGPYALIAYVQLAVSEGLRRLAGEAQQDGSAS
ncbi:hypothetical protein AB0N14_13655 [Streptomyces sp. NPDC051104]|uniref:hypothetical protein n=1 Tax=Streptomyces sp. NPDC051104 TaxID=3155044 RepID=UPI003440EDDF